MQPSELGGADKDVHEHLMKDCSWYRRVSEERCCTDPDEHCGAGKRQSSSGVIYKLTPHTAEASTVPKPTVPPGGPGLFHHKGLELPPYIQHLWVHLAGKYGKHQAYGMAVGLA